MARLLRRFAEDRAAATAIEYSLIAAGVALAIVAAVSNLGSAVTASYVRVDTALK
jgi:pilus assembly protein Flp/PilA